LKARISETTRQEACVINSLAVLAAEIEARERWEEERRWGEERERWMLGGVSPLGSARESEYPFPYTGVLVSPPSPLVSPLSPLAPTFECSGFLWPVGEGKIGDVRVGSVPELKIKDANCGDEREEKRRSSMNNCDVDMMKTCTASVASSMRKRHSTGEKGTPRIWSDTRDLRNSRGKWSDGKDGSECSPTESQYEGFYTNEK